MYAIRVLYVYTFLRQLYTWTCTGPALSQLDQLLVIGLRTGVIYSQLFKYTQHTAGFTETQQHTAGFTETQQHTAGFTETQQHTAGFTETQQHTAGFTENN